MSHRVAVISVDELEGQTTSQAELNWVLAALTASGHQAHALAYGDQFARELVELAPDVAYLVSSNPSSEAGSVQATLTFLQIPFVGSRAEVHRIASDKAALGALLAHEGRYNPLAAHIPHGICLPAELFADEGTQIVLDRIGAYIPEGYPLCVKPACSCNARGVERVDAPEQLKAAIEAALAEGGDVIIQQWVCGVELSVTILGEDDDVEALPAVEVQASTQAPFSPVQAVSPEASDALSAPVPLAHLAADESNAQGIRSEIERAALDAFLAAGGRDLGRADIVWDGAQAYVLELDLAPNLAPGSRAGAAIAAAGLDPAEELCRLVEVACERGAETFVA